MARLSVLVALAAVLAGGCGGHSTVVVRTNAPVTALALDDKRLAWTDCHRVHVLEGDGDVQLRLPPAAESACGTEGELVLAGSNVGWFFASSDRDHHAFALGASSTTSGASRLLRAERFYDEKAYAGLHGGIAADGNLVLWTWPKLALSGPEDAVYYCGSYSGQAACMVSISDAHVHAWAGGAAAVADDLPPAGPIAAADGWVAAAIVPVGTRSQARTAGARTIVVARPGDGRVIARVRSDAPVDAAALSHRLLAIETAARVELFRLPSGRRLRSIAVRSRTSYRFTGWIAVAGTKLILWDPDSVSVVDADSGRRTVLVRTSGSRGLSNRPITAVAATGTRIAWATTSPNGGSIIRTRAL